MKFWQKIFFSTLIIFIVIFNAGAWIISSHSYEFNLKRETDSVVREQGVILSSVESGINNAEKVFAGASKNDVNLSVVVEPLAAFYAPQGIRLGLFNGDDTAYSLGFDVEDNLLKIQNELNANIADKKIEGVRYLFVASKVPEYEHL